MKKEKTKKIRSAVVRDSLDTFGTNLFGAALGLISSFIVLRRVDRVTKGLFNQVQQWGGGLNTVLGLSIVSAVTYYVARNSIQNSKRAIRRLSAAITAAIVLVGAAMLVVLRGSSFFNETPPGFLAAIVIYGALSFLFAVCTAALRGENKFRSYNMVNLVQRILVTALAVAVFLHPDAAFWVWSTIAVSAGMLLFALYGLVRWNGPKPKPAPENDFSVGTGDMIRYSLKSHVSNVLTYLNSFLGTYIVQGLYSLSDYSIYSTAVTIMQQVWVLPDAVSQVILSRIAGMTEQKDKVRLSVLSSKIVTYITTVSAVLLYWAAKIFVPILFPIYKDSVEPLPYLVVGYVLISYAKVLGNSIAAYGRPELNIIPTAFGIAANVASSLLLIPRMGINGVALSASISLTVQSVACVTIFCRFSHVPVYRLIVPEKEEIAAVRRIFRKQD